MAALVREFSAQADAAAAAWQSLCSVPATAPPQSLVTLVASQLEASAQLLHAARSDLSAHLPHAQKRLAAVTRVGLWQTAVASSTPWHLRWLTAGAEVGGRSWVEVHPDNQLRLTQQGFVLCSQFCLGLPVTAVPCTEVCSACCASLPGGFEPEDLLFPSVASHATGHGELLGAHCHTPLVAAVEALFMSHGHAVVRGDLDPPGTHRHSADLTVLHWNGPGRHLRVDVKTGCECGASNLSARAGT